MRTPAMAAKPLCINGLQRHPHSGTQRVRDEEVASSNLATPTIHKPFPIKHLHIFF